MMGVISGDIKILDPDHEIVAVEWVAIETANERMSYLTDQIKIAANRYHHGAPYYY
jgi:hypothetical protein